MEIVASFLASIVRGFLQSHGYVTELSCEEPLEERQESPRKKRRIQRIHTEEIDGSAGHNGNPADAIDYNSTAPCIDLVRVRLMKFDSYQNHFPQTNDSQYQKWTDGRTGQTFIIDLRTGHTCNTATSQQQTIDVCLDDRRGDRRTLSLRPSATESNRPTTPDWLRDALKVCSENV